MVSLRRLERLAAHLPSRISLVVLAAVSMTAGGSNLVPSEDDAVLPAFGPDGGTPFTARCPAYSYVTGFAVRAGHDIDAIGIFCGELNRDGSRGRESRVGLFGGPGGVPTEANCHSTVPFARDVEIQEHGLRSRLISRVNFRCGWVAGPLPRAVPGYSFHSLRYDSAARDAARDGGEVDRAAESPVMSCPEGFGIVGIHGRADTWVSAVGIICSPLRTAPQLKSDRAAPASGSDAASRPCRDLATAERQQADRPTVGSRLFGRSSAGGLGDIAVNQDSRPVAQVATESASNDFWCRGGAAMQPSFNPAVASTPGGTTLWVVFGTSSRVAAGEGGSALEPGQCGFVTRPWPAGDPPQFMIEVPAAELDAAARMATNLKIENHLWQLAVVNSNRGYLRVTRYSDMSPPCVVKGNISATSGRKYYYVPGSPNYEQVVIDPRLGERCFQTAEEAEEAGWMPYRVGG